MPWGTLAKAFKGAAVSSRSAFAALHGAGAAGLAFGTQACVFSGITAVTGTVSTFLGSEACEDE
ncbi:hypothetical protein DPMN_101581 [Dreissena polymorpha]|uniref:Uncharacterized protein n=2 Tax=Dreissena polymorpha TaxID=45954 RepID=A0A9D4LJ72_DREPO|nr:hypothetical protein DPMN_101581 [Dreissena polymorpha]